MKQEYVFYSYYDLETSKKKIYRNLGHADELKSRFSLNYNELLNSNWKSYNSFHNYIGETHNGVIHCQPVNPVFWSKIAIEIIDLGERVKVRITFKDYILSFMIVSVLLFFGISIPLIYLLMTQELLGLIMLPFFTLPGLIMLFIGILRTRKTIRYFQRPFQNK